MTEETSGQPTQEGEPQGVPPTPFQMLCGSLAAQVHMALGLIPDPTEKDPRVELDAARQGIEMMAMLEEKTKGNLDEREAKSLGLLLAQLQMIFVERYRELKSKDAPAAKDDAPETKDAPAAKDAPETKDDAPDDAPAAEEDGE